MVETKRNRHASVRKRSEQVHHVLCSQPQRSSSAFLLRVRASLRRVLFLRPDVHTVVRRIWNVHWCSHGTSVPDTGLSRRVGPRLHRGQSDRQSNFSRGHCQHAWLRGLERQPGVSSYHKLQRCSNIETKYTIHYPLPHHLYPQPRLRCVLHHLRQPLRQRQRRRRGQVRHLLLAVRRGHHLEDRTHGADRHHDRVLQRQRRRHENHLLQGGIRRRQQLCDVNEQRRYGDNSLE